MANLKRYNITDSSMYYGPEIDENKNGEWVKFDDVKEFLKTPHNSASDAIALLKRFLLVVPRGSISRDAREFIERQQHT